MPSVQFGSRKIAYSILVKDGLKSHYIHVDKDGAVVLKGKKVSPSMADKIILQKANWIIDKLKTVEIVASENIVTGSRIPFLGKRYPVDVVYDKKAPDTFVTFNKSRFTITLNKKTISQSDIKGKLEAFYKRKAVEKISPRVEKHAMQTRLRYRTLRFSKMTTRWGSCSVTNGILLNTEAIKLPYPLIDYLIVHELAHTKVKDHSKRFWNEVSKHCADWKKLDDKMKEIQL